MAVHSALSITSETTASTFIPSRASRILPTVVGVAAYLILCPLLQTIAPDFNLLPGEWSWNLAAGLSVGFLLIFGLAYIPIVFSAYMIPLMADGSVGIALWTSVAFAAGNSVAFSFPSYIVRRRIGADVDLEDRRTLMVFLTLIPVTALLAAFCSTMNFWVAGIVLWNSLIEAFLIKTFANGLGVLLVGSFVLLNLAPVLTLGYSGAFDMSKPRNWVQAIVLLLLAAGAVVAIATVSVDRFEVYLLFFVPLLAMALKFGLRGLAASFLVIGCTRMVMTWLGYTSPSGLTVETTILVALISTLIVAILSTERARTREILHRQTALIRDAVAQMTHESRKIPEGDNDLEQLLNDLSQEVEAAVSRARVNEIHLNRQEQQSAPGRGTRNRLALKDLR